MFGFLRRMIVPIMTIALVGFLATIIFQWGMDINSRDQYVQGNLAAVINGQEISWEVFNQYYNNLYQAEILKTDNELPDTKVRELQQSAWQQIKQDVLMIQQAEEYNLTSTDDEIYFYLRSSPPAELRQAQYFQTNGQFDAQKYLSALADPNYAGLWNQFEPVIREQIRKKKLYSTIVQTVHVTDNEVRNIFIETNEKIKVGMINIPGSRYSANIPKFTDEEISAYFDKNQSNYQLEERGTGKIVVIDKVVTDNDWQIIEDQIFKIYDTVNNGADFAEYARLYSQDGSASKGGDLGWFSQGQMVAAFDSVVFSLNKGEISKPVKTQFGFHVIKLFDTKEEMIAKPGETKKEKVKRALASHILIKAEITQQSMEAYFNQIENFRDLALEKGFEEAAAQTGMEIKNIRGTEKNTPLPFIGREQRANDFLFQDELNQISPVWENSNLIFVLQNTAILPAGLAPFEDVKSAVSRDLNNETIQQICDDTAKAIYDDIQIGTDISKAAKKFGFEYEELQDITRTSTIKGLGRNVIALASAFALKDVNQISEPVSIRNGALIFKLLDRISPDLSEFATQRDSLRTNLVNTRQQKLFNDWYLQLVENSEIISNIEERYSSSDY